MSLSNTNRLNLVKVDNNLKLDQPVIEKKPIFQASYPSYLKRSLLRKVINLIYDILSIIFLPIGICRYIHYKIHTFLGYYLFVPSQSYSKREKIYKYLFNGEKQLVLQKDYLNEGREGLKKEFGAKEINIKTADGVKLNGIFIPGKNSFGRTLNKDAPLIIHFLGQLGRYEDLWHYDVISNIRKCNIIVFNNSGVVKSEGRASKKGLLIEADSILQYALKKLRVPIKDIIAHGHSFGGCQATFLASKYKETKLLNDRSFASVEKAMYYMAQKYFHQLFSSFFIMPFVLIGKIASQKVIDKIDNFVKFHKIYDDEKLLRPRTLAFLIKAISSIIAYFLAKIAIIFDWNLEPEKYWKRVKGKKLIVCLADGKDETIPHEASLFKNVQKQDREFMRVLDPEAMHWRPFKKEISNKIFRTLGL